MCRYAELLEEQRRRIEEQRRLEELRRQEEERRLEELRREEERRRLEEEREQKRLEEERRLAEERRLKEEEEKQKLREEEEQRLKEKEEERRLKEQRRLEEERRNEEKRKLLEEERMKELKRQKEDRRQQEMDDIKQKETINTSTKQKRTSELTSSRQSALHWSKDLSEDDDFEALMKGLTESLDDLEQLAEEGHKIYDTLTQDRLKKRPPLHYSMIETSREKSVPSDSPVNGEEEKYRSLKHQSSESVLSVKERQKKLISQSSINPQHRPLQRARANSQTVMALEQASR